MIGIIRKMAQTGLDERSEKLLEEIEKEDGPDAEIYVVSNRKHLFGASCMLAEDFLRELAERTESSLLIYPVNTMEVMIYPLEKGNKNHMDTKDMQRINRNSDPGEECLSNSIYLYDRTKQEISVYKKGEPL